MDNHSSFDRRRFLKTAGFFGLLGRASKIGAAGLPPDGKLNELLVGVAPSTSARRTAQRALPSEARIVGENDTLGYVRAELPERASASATASVANTVASRRGVEYAEPNAVYETLVAPNDPRFGDQYAPEMVNAPAAWDTTLGESDVTVAVIDQGVKYDHPDLEANVASDHGRDFVDDDDDPYPDSLSKEDHGTHVAGIAAAGTDNDTGIAGISNATLLGIRALDESGSGTTADIADGIQWAVDDGADIINLSLGGGGFTETLQKAVSYAHEEDVLLVAAAGNSAGSVNYPAAYDECVAVSALDPDGSLASYSSRGPEIELAAPGTNVLSTWTDDNYATLSGTSMAAPVVSGVAALVLSRRNYSTDRLRTHLKDTAVDSGLGSSEQGTGRIDASTIGDLADSTLSIQGTGSHADYTFSVTSDLETSTANGGTTDSSDSITESTATGYVWGGTDAYTFSGDLESFDLDGEATVTLDGEPAHVGQRPDHVLAIEGTGSHADYTFSVTSDLETSTANGGTTGSSDSISESTATGYVWGGTDSYTFSGDLESFALDGEATVTLDGEPAHVGQRPDHVLAIEGTGSRADYAFSVTSDLETSTANGATTGSSDTVSGSSATGYVWGGTDAYTFSGDILALGTGGDAGVFLDGERIDPVQYPNILSIRGTGSRADYTISVSGTLEKSTANGGTTGSSDSISGSSATGYVWGGTDSYTFSGELRDISVDGDATVYLNGKEVNTTLPAIGIHNGLSDGNFDTINRMEEWQNTDYAVQNLFVPWNPDKGHMNWLFDQILPQIWNAGRTPLITWEPYTPSARTASVDTQSLVERNEYSAYLESLTDTTPDDIEVRIKNGEYDGYIDRWANRLQNALSRSGGRRAYLRLAHEMNGDWYPWSPTVGNSSPGSYVGMWRRVHNRLDRQGLGGDDLQWMWCVNAEDVGSYTAEQLYPSNGYVDWLSLDGYQWGRSQSWSSWRSPDSIYGGMLDRLGGLGDKPVCVAEFASSSKVSGGHDPQRKDAWIRDALAYFEKQGIDMWCWFNEDKETDWAVFNGMRGTETVAHNRTQVNAYSAYRKSVDTYGSAANTTATEPASLGQAASDD